MRRLYYIILYYIYTLCVSTDMLVTPASLKSKDGTLKPAFGIKQIKNPPRQASTWTGILYFTPKSEIALILSIVPYGKFGVDPINYYKYYINSNTFEYIT